LIFDAEILCFVVSDVMDWFGLDWFGLGRKDKVGGYGMTIF